MRHSFVVALLAVAAISACKTDRAPGTDTTRSAPTTAQAGASAAPAAAGVRITSPARGATTGKDVTVTMQAQGVTIAKADSKKVEGVGHFHLFLDTIPTADNVRIPPTSAKIVHIGTGDSTFTFKGLSAGPHTIIAVIGYGDHSPMPGRRDTVNITVKP
ncbi:MAG TPA: DUF4399 domain-containing protein [Gemmatimonadaceae bacterium]|nr:DUF4399 domain-containing protein [Gemmatimonadaceae bacterium]